MPMEQSEGGKQRRWRDDGTADVATMEVRLARLPNREIRSIVTGCMDGRERGVR